MGERKDKLMKTMKKIMVLVLSVLMVLGTTMVTSFAADKNDSITVNGVKEGETISIYKMFDLKVNSESNPTAYSYTINEGWTAFFTGQGAGAAYITVNNAGYVTEISDAAALAKAAAGWSGKPEATDSKTVGQGGTSVVFEGLADGYWLITSTLGTKAMIDTTPDKAAVTVNEKNPEDSVEKKVKEDSAYTTSNDAQIGDKVEFQTTATLEPYTTKVKIHDVMDSGLSFNNDIAISGGTPAITANDYEILSTPDNGDTFTIKIKDSYIATMTAQSVLTITYSANLTVAAVDSTPAIVDQKNKATISYGDNQSKSSETTTTTHKFAVHKYASGVEYLEGATFQIKNGNTVLKLTKIDNANYKVDPNGALTEFTTISTGNVTIWGVDTDGTYTLVETQEPEGYNRLTAPISVTVDADNNKVVDIENKAGTELPSTGGMGTTILYIVGAVLVIGCGIMLVAKKRTNK